MINSKIIASLFLSLAFSSPAFSQLNRNLMKQARIYAKAMEKGKWEKVADLTYPEIVKLAGGSARYIKQSKNSSMQLENQGFSIDMAELSSPFDTVKEGNKILSIIPMRVTFEGPLGKLYSESSLLAISLDDGETWKFISMSQTGLDEIVLLFPNGSKKLVFPTKKVYQDN